MAKPKYPSIFPRKFRAEYPNTSSVYKIWAGDKFFIWKGQMLHNSLYHICGDIERWCRIGLREDHLFYKLLMHIKDAGIVQLEIEVVLQWEGAFELLKCERLMLISWIGDPACLNRSDKPHIPKWAITEEIEAYNNWDRIHNK